MHAGSKFIPMLCKSALQPPSTATNVDFAVAFFPVTLLNQLKAKQLASKTEPASRNVDVVTYGMQRGAAAGTRGFGENVLN